MAQRLLFCRIARLLGGLRTCLAPGKRNNH
jgi:hypothetical protein